MKEKRNTIYKKNLTRIRYHYFFTIKKIDLNNPRDRLVFVF